ncbi:transposase [Sphingomonas sp. CFBP 13603]|uniref:transposase n=1 Tax=Sphingomonas sp. CFBP 13603 TaxID=2774040 RepID=UPI00314021F8
MRRARPFARRLHNQGSPELVEGLHARCDGQGRPLCFVLTPGQAHDVKGFGPLFGMLADRIEALLADKGYDADAIRQELFRADVEAVIPTKSNRRIPIPHDCE